MSDLIGNPEEWFPHKKSHLSLILRVFGQVIYKPDSTAAEDGLLYYLCSKNKDADQLCCYRVSCMVTAQLNCPFASAYAKSRFSQEDAHFSAAEQVGLF